MSWHFLERWVEKANQHSTLIGKFWITFLIVCRMVIVATVGDRVYNDEQSEFKCNTLQPGCTNVCFNDFSPISHLRFWSFQILFVATPSVMFVIYSAHKTKVKKAWSARKAGGSCDDDERGISKRLSRSKLAGGSKGHNEKKERRRRRYAAKHDDEAKCDFNKPSKTSLCSFEKYQQWRKHNAPWAEGASPFPQSTLIRLRESCDPDNQLEKDSSMVNNRRRASPRASLSSHLMNPNQIKNNYYVAENVNNNNSCRDQFFIWKKPGRNDAEEMMRVGVGANLVNGVASMPQSEAEAQGMLLNSLPGQTSPNKRNLRKESKYNFKEEDCTAIPPSPFGPIPSAPPGYPGLDDQPIGKPSVEPWVTLPKEFETSPCFKEKKSKHSEKSSKEPSELKQPAILFAEHFRWYVANVFVRLCLEVGFAVMQLKLFGLHVPELYKCKRWPCPNMVDCFISRPSEKTIFLWFMFIYSCICVLLNVVEIIYLFYASIAKELAERKQRHKKRLKCEKQIYEEKLDFKNRNVKSSGLVAGPLVKDKGRQMVLIDGSSTSWSSKNLHPGSKPWQAGRRGHSVYVQDGRKEHASQEFIAIMLDSEDDDDNEGIDMARAEEDDINEMEEQNIANYDLDLNMGLDNDDGGDQAGSM